jgi:hypothetical protein
MQNAESEIIEEVMRGSGNQGIRKSGYQDISE